MTASAKELNSYIKQLTDEEKKQLALELKKQLPQLCEASSLAELFYRLRRLI